MTSLTEHSSSAFELLPAELRVKIYHNLIDSSSKDHEFPVNVLRTMRLNKKIYREFQDELWQERELHIILHQPHRPFWTVRAVHQHDTTDSRLEFSHLPDLVRGCHIKTILIILNMRSWIKREIGKSHQEKYEIGTSKLEKSAKDLVHVLSMVMSVENSTLVFYRTGASDKYAKLMVDRVLRAWRVLADLKSEKKITVVTDNDYRYEVHDEKELLEALAKV